MNITNEIHENIKINQQYKNIFKNSTICPSKHATSDNTRTFILIFKQIKIQIYIYSTILYSINFSF